MATFGQWFLGIVLLAAAGAKWQDRSSFFRVLVAIPWLPVSNARRLSWVIPVLEAAVAVVLIAAPRPGAVATVALLSSFTAVVAAEMLAGRTFECGCFGAGTGGLSGVVTLARNTVLMAVALVVILTPGTAGTAAALTGAGVALLLVLSEAAAATRSAVRAS